VAGFREALRARDAEFDKAQRGAVARMITDRAINNSMFAMLARQDGNWKIVCISFLKSK
jgi:hypothetical protein